MQKPPMTVDEHEALGRELYRIRNRLQRIGVDLAERYGKSNLIGRLALEMHRAIDPVRIAVDSRFAREPRTPAEKGQSMEAPK